MKIFIQQEDALQAVHLADIIAGIVNKSGLAEAKSETFDGDSKSLEIEKELHSGKISISMVIDKDNHVTYFEFFETEKVIEFKEPKIIR